MDTPFDNQVIFKLATIETKVQGIAENLVAAVHRLEDKITETNQAQASALAEVRTELKTVKGQVSALEKYRDNLIARVSGIMLVITVFWALFGSAIETTVKEIF